VQRWYDSPGAANLNDSGIAIFPTSSLAAGSHSITASYGGDSMRSSSVSPPKSASVNSTDWDEQRTGCISFGTLMNFPVTLATESDQVARGIGALMAPESPVMNFDCG
jgi:hypothetical protein